MRHKSQENSSGKIKHCWKHRTGFRICLEVVILTVRKIHFSCPGLAISVAAGKGNAVMSTAKPSLQVP